MKLRTGIFKDVETTNQVIKNGWLHTGDLAKIDKDGFIYLVARKKEIIKVGGKRVSPKEIEDVILAIPEVEDCIITGFDDELLGEAILATVVLNNTENKEHMTDKILKECSKHLSLYKIPQKIVFDKTIQLSATGKKRIK